MDELWSDQAWFVPGRGDGCQLPLRGVGEASGSQQPEISDEVCQSFRGRYFLELVTVASFGCINRTRINPVYIELTSETD